MKLKTILLSAILFLFTISPAYSQSTNSLGFAVGGTYGIGLSYSYDTPTWGIQVTGLPIWDEQSGGQVFGGINIKRNFHENGKVGIYGSIGIAGGFWRETDEYCNWNEKTKTDDCSKKTDEGWGLVTGPGVGMQVLFWKNMLLRFELPLAVRFSSDGFGISPIPNFALLYRW